MSEDIILHALSNVGVPAAVCFYTLFAVNKNLEKLTNAFDRWSDLIDRRLKDLEEDVKDIESDIKYLKASRTDSRSD